MRKPGKLLVPPYTWSKLAPWILAFALILLFWPLLTAQVSMRWDAPNIYLPWKYHITESLKNGFLPAWNPSMSCGFPQMGDPGTWYPISWLIGFLFYRYDFAALNLEYLVHLLIAGIGFYRAASLYIASKPVNLMIALAFMLSGFFISQAQHLGWIVSAAWFPWAYLYTFLLAKTPSFRTAILLSLVLFLLFTGGYPGFTIVTGYVLAVVYIMTVVTTKPEEIPTTKKWFNLVWVPIIFLILASPAIIGVRELFSSVTRGEGLGNSGALSFDFGALSGNGLLSILFPYALTSDNPGFWQSDTTLLNTYIGLIPLLALFLALFQKGKPWTGTRMILIGVFFMLIALAGVTPLRAWLNHVVPLLDLFRFPTLFRYYAIFFLLLGAGLFLEQVMKEKTVRQRFAIVFIAAGTMLVIWMTVLATQVSFDQIRSFFLPGSGFMEKAGIPEKIFIQAGIHVLLLTMGSLVIILGRESRQFPLYLFLILLIDLGLAVRLNLYASVADPSNLRPTIEAYRRLPTGFPFPSLQRPMNEITDDQYYHTIPLSWRNVPVFHKMPSPEAYNPYTLQITRKAIQEKTFDRLLQYPLLFFSHDLNDLPDPDHAAANCHIQILEYGPNGLTIAVDAREHGHLLFLQNHYPRWKAYVNGKEVPLSTVYHTFMALEMPAGSHQIQFVFHIYDLKWAWIASMAVFFLCLAFLVFSWLRTLPPARKRRSRYGLAMLIFLTSLLIALHTARRIKARGLMNHWVSMMEQVGINQAYHGNTAILLNADRMIQQEDLPAGQGLSYARVDHEHGYCSLADLLTRDGLNHVLFGQVNMPHYPEIRSLVKRVFPEVIREEDHGEAWFILASRSKDTRLESYDGASDFFADARIADCTLGENQAFSASLSWDWDDLFEATAGVFKIGFEMEGQAGMNPGIVITTKDDEIVKSWEMHPLGKYFCDSTRNIPLTKEIDLRRIKSPGQKLIIYLWNPDPGTVGFSNIRLE